MKKILIVNNNMNVGGVQKSLYNLLWSMDESKKYDITLLLFSKTGEYIKKLPESIRVIECKGPFRYLGKNQNEFKTSLKDTLFRGFFAALSKVFGRSFSLKLMLLTQPKLAERFDYAVSFFQNGRKNAFYGGTQDYVISCVNAKKKIAFLHCDYNKCGANHQDNNQLISEFDKIVACSDGCRLVFESALPELKNRCVTVKNFHRFDEIKALAEEKTLIYDDTALNVIIVARLSHEKGLDRAIKAVASSLEKGLCTKLHIVGDGAERKNLEEIAASLGIKDNVIFYGEQSNPYRFMKNADLFLLTSYHEAAPMVIDEARCLGLPVLTTQTTSSKEMVTEEGSGWVCENSQEALNEALFKVLSDKNELKLLKSRLSEKGADNSKAHAQFDDLFKN